MNIKKFQPYSLSKTCKKFHYPFQKIEVEATGPFKDSISAQAEAANMNLTFLLIHGIFMLNWYLIVIGFWIYYLMGYTAYWLICVLIEFIRSKKANSNTSVNNENADSNNPQNV